MSAATPPAAAQRRADALRRAAQAKRQTATARADAAIRQLVKNKQEINFRSVARTGGISIDFLYTAQTCATASNRCALSRQPRDHSAPPSLKPATPREASFTSSPPSFARNARPAAPPSTTSSSGSPPHTENSSGSGASWNSTASKPDHHVTDAIRNVTTCENVTKVKASAR